MSNKPATVGELRASGYEARTVRDEMRENLVAKIRAGEEIFPAIKGYKDTVIPALENAILAGQDVIFLGERGQAKSRMIRSLVTLLDDEIPVLDGPEIPEDPFNPISHEGLELVADKAKKIPFDPSAKIGPRITQLLLEEGVIHRAILNTLAYAPPLVMTESDVDEMVGGGCAGDWMPSRGISCGRICEYQHRSP